MEEIKVSRTAEFMTYLRGYHAAHDYPKIFDDFLAQELVGKEVCEFYDQRYTSAKSLEFVEALGFKGAASCDDKAVALSMAIQAYSPLGLPVSRSRYAEDKLDQAVRQGVRQYVILGAGLDTFAFRRPEMLEKMQVFEVDHPVMQAYKRHRLTEVGWEQPAQLHFVPVDFLHDSLAAALARSTYDPQSPSFFSWLGVTFYLPRETVFNTFAAITDAASAGTTVVFDYVHSDVFVPARTTPLIQRGLQYLRDEGEPWITGFEPFELVTNLAKLGLRLHEDLSPQDIQERFFQGRKDNYHAYELVHFTSATVE